MISLFDSTALMKSTITRKKQKRRKRRDKRNADKSTSNVQQLCSTFATPCSTAVQYRLRVISHRMGRQTMLQMWHTMRCTAMSKWSSPNSSNIVYGVDRKREGRHHAQTPPTMRREKNPETSKIGEAMLFLASARARATITLGGREKEREGGEEEGEGEEKEGEEEKERGKWGGFERKRSVLYEGVFSYSTLL